MAVIYNPFAKIRELEARVLDLERHFVTKRDANGSPTETLADVPLEKRKKAESLKGLSWPQRKWILELTDGGRKPIG